MALGLDEVDERILFHLDVDARVPETTLAKRVGRSKESVRYRIRQLEERGIITGYSVWIDPTVLGYQTYKLYLKLKNKPGERKDFLRFIKSEKTVFWLGIGAGVWHVGITFFARNNSEFYRLRQKIFSKFGDLILSSYTASIVDALVMSKKFWDNEKVEMIRIFGDPGSFEIDDLDKGIIRLLFKNARTKLVKLARMLNSNPETIKSRIKRMEQSGFIVFYRGAIDFNLLGYELFKTFVYFSNLSEDEEKAFVDYVKNKPNIIHFLRTFAPWEMELEVLVKSYEEYARLIDDMEEKFSGVILNIESTIMSGDYVYPSKEVI